MDAAGRDPWRSQRSWAPSAPATTSAVSVSDPHLTVKEVAAELNVSVDQAKKLILGSHIPAIDVGVGGRSFWRVPRKDFDKWKADKRAETERRLGPWSGR